MSRPSGLWTARGSLEGDPRALGLFGDLFGPDEESPEERAERLLGDGDWALQQTLDADGLTFPCVLEVSLEDPVFSFSTEHLGVLWDGEIVASGPLVVEEGTKVLVRITRQQGQVLEVWCTDDVVSSVRVVTPAEAQAIERQAREEEGRTVLDSLASLLRVTEQTQANIVSLAKTLAVVAVVGGIIYLAVEAKPFLAAAAKGR